MQFETKWTIGNAISIASTIMGAIVVIAYMQAKIDYLTDTVIDMRDRVLYLERQQRRDDRLNMSLEPPIEVPPNIWNVTEGEVP